MRIPSRYLTKEKPVEPVLEKVVHIDERKAMEQAVNEIKKVLNQKLKKEEPKKALKYVFSIIRDQDGLMTEIVASPVEPGTLL